MPISFACQHCQRNYCVDDGMAGKKAKCKECGQAMEIPAVTATTAVPQSGTTQANRKQQPTPQKTAAKTATKPQPAVRAKPDSKSVQPQRSAKPRTTSSANDARAAQQYGLTDFQVNDPFAGANPNGAYAQLGNHVVDPGFAPVTPEEIAFRREHEISQLRDRKPQLEDYLNEEDRAAYLTGDRIGGSTEVNTGIGPWIPGMITSGLCVLFGLLSILFGILGIELATLICFIILIAISVLAGIAGEIWGGVICYRNDSDKFIWYFLFPIYRVIYMFANFPYMKGPFMLWATGFIGSFFIIISLMFLEPS
jgi:hypothetical protein